MTIFGIQIPFFDTILALVCLFGVMMAIIGDLKRSFILECIGVTIAVIGGCLAFHYLR